MIRIHIYTCPKYEKQSMQAHFFKRGVYVRSTDKLPYSDYMLQLITGNKPFEVVNVDKSRDLDLRLFKSK